MLRPESMRVSGHQSLHQAREQSLLRQSQPRLSGTHRPAVADSDIASAVGSFVGQLISASGNSAPRTENRERHQTAVDLEALWVETTAAMARAPGGENRRSQRPATLAAAFCLKSLFAPEPALGLTRATLVATYGAAVPDVFVKPFPGRKLKVDAGTKSTATFNRVLRDALQLTFGDDASRLHNANLSLFALTRRTDVDVAAVRQFIEAKFDGQILPAHVGLALSTRRRNGMRKHRLSRSEICTSLPVAPAQPRENSDSDSDALAMPPPPPYLCPAGRSPTDTPGWLRRSSRAACSWS